MIDSINIIKAATKKKFFGGKKQLFKAGVPNTTEGLLNVEKKHGITLPEEIKIFY